jgi:predicted component of type VI protein secretion system
MHLRVRFDAEGGKSTTHELAGDVVRLGRNPECEVSVDPLAFPKVSGFHARIETTDDGFSLVHLSRNNPTLLNDTEVDGSSPISVGDRIRLGFTGPEIEILVIEATAAVNFDQTAKADARQMALLRGSAGTRRLELGRSGVIGREAGAVAAPDQ